MNHTEFLNKLIEERGYQSFLEIGYGTGANFKAIQIKEKTSIDPVMYKQDRHENTDENIQFIELDSDSFFDGLDGRKKYDIFFIDGDHKYQQLERDIINCMKHLKKGGIIVIHDILPHNEAMQKVPREQREWTGDCWRCWVGLKDKYPELGAYAIKEDYGIGVIPYNKEVKIEPGFSSQMLYKQFEEVKDMYFGA